MTKIIKSLIISFISFRLIFAYVSVAIAQEPITIQPVTPFTTPQQAIDMLIPALLGAGALACFAYILYGAYKYITAGDAPANVSAARQTIINACIGLILLALSFVIWQFVLGMTGIGSSNGTGNTSTGQQDSCPSGTIYIEGRGCQ